MYPTICLILLCVFLSSIGWALDNGPKHMTSYLITNKANELFLKRSKRFLIFEKGAAVTFQANIAKSVISGFPRGLNEIAEYTLIYDLPTDYHIFNTKSRPTKISTTTTAPTTVYHPIKYYHQGVPNSKYYYAQNRNVMQRINYEKRLSKPKCNRRNFYDYKTSISKICLNRIKRNSELSELTTSQRMFYDLIEKWSLIHGFLPRYCFMRTLCESSHLLLPYGHSLLHDIIHILLRQTKSWAVHHKIWGRSLRQQHRREECAQLYGPHCRVSWLQFISHLVHGSRFADLMH